MTERMARLLSIVTVTRDNNEGLSKTYDSIRKQLLKPPYSPVDFEWVVIDGASADGTAQFLSCLSPCFCFSYVSEEDSGIFNAMNKALSLTSGKYLLFLNAGDVFDDEESLQSFLPYLFDHEILVAGSVRCVWLEASVEKSLHPWVCHQAVFIPRWVFEHYRYDETKKYFGDLCLWKALKRDNLYKVRRIDRIVSRFEMGGVGNSPNYLFQRLRERIQVGKEFGDRIPQLARVGLTMYKYTLWRLFGNDAYYRHTMGFPILRKKLKGN